MNEWLNYAILWGSGDIMSNYYNECLEKIENFIQEGKLSEASKLIDEELSMPYVPIEFEEKLKELKKETLPAKKKNMLSDEEMEMYIDKGEIFQLLVVKELKERNIRQYLDMIQHLFDVTESMLVKISLIEICIDQQLTEEFKVNKDGLDVHFIPAACVLPQDSDGFDACLDYLKEWLENEDPTLYDLCKQTALKEAYLHLPFEIEESEAEDMALAIVMYVSEMMECEEAVKKMLCEKNASQKATFELLLYSNTI